MSSEPQSSPDLDFERGIPLFPLPNCVLFPGAIQPLHIFEPRYQELMAATLRDQSAIALGLLKPGWEQNYHGAPAVHEVLCVGKIIAHEMTSDGKYNLLLHGITRGRILSQDKSRAYRTVQVAAIPDTPPFFLPNPAHDALQRKILRDLLAKTALKDLTIASSMDPFFDVAVPLARLVDVLSFNLVQDIDARQRLLEELSPTQRGELLTQHLIAMAQQLGQQQVSAGIPGNPAWPPPLNTN